MIALSPDRLSWQKTTCSWSARPVPPGFVHPGQTGQAEPFSLGGIPNTLVTVATLLISSRLLTEPGSEPSVLPDLRGLRLAVARGSPRAGPGLEQAGPREADAFRTGW
jgi:hypothetical protein